MKLYYAPANCSLAPHIVLREAGAPFELVRVDTATHTLEDGSDYHAINPKGQVPVLQLDDGSRLTEGPIICQYIADRADNRALMPAPGSMQRYRVMEWQNYITSELHKGFSPLFNTGLDPAVRQTFADALKNKLAWVCEQIGDRPYLTGDTFTAADAYLFVVTGWAPFVKLDVSDLDVLTAYRARIAERPSVSAALRAEGLV
ncbi:MAG: glutathione transferase GstA [Nevskiales bacterium]|nr:glutathione transferase GstA [Nevskiales bacterium]